MNHYCPNCNRDVTARIDKRKETFPVRGDEVEVSSTVLVCPACKADIFDSEIDGRTLDLAYAAHADLMQSTSSR